MIPALISEDRKDEKMSMNTGKTFCTFNSFRWLAHLARCFFEYSRFRAARVEFEERLIIFRLLKIDREYRRELAETPFYTRNIPVDLAIFFSQVITHKRGWLSMGILHIKSLTLPVDRSDQVSQHTNLATSP